MHTTLQRNFPDSKVSMVHQDGSKTPPDKGLEVVLFTREHETDPCLAELASEDYGAEIGLTFEGKELIDFDGAFSLPGEVVEMLQDLGYFVSDDLFA